jgi:hypothetical protein
MLPCVGASPSPAVVLMRVAALHRGRPAPVARYVALFNVRNRDGVGAMLAEDMQPPREQSGRARSGRPLASDELAAEA